MVWNYRVVRRCTILGGEPTESYTIHEVYYDTEPCADPEKPKLWSLHPVSPAGETMEELQRDLGHMAEAFNKPTLNYEDLPQATRKRRRRRS